MGAQGAIRLARSRYTRSSRIKASRATSLEVRLVPLKKTLLPSSRLSRKVGVGPYPPQVRVARATGVPNTCWTRCRTARGIERQAGLDSTPERTIYSLYDGHLLLAS